MADKIIFHIDVNSAYLSWAKAANIRSIAKKYQLKAPVYVGDTFGDYQACQEAGVPFVFASYGFGQVDTPDYVIEKPADLLKLF